MMGKGCLGALVVPFPVFDLAATVALGASNYDFFLAWFAFGLSLWPWGS